jgi:phenylpropionate dioxygenase-like ring-hydroxylating dioxygenase large terminal subunit
VCFPAETVARADFDERARHYYDRFDTALAEDIAMLERQQAGLTSPHARPGRFADLEPSVATFAHWYAKRMLAPVASPVS